MLSVSKFTQNNQSTFTKFNYHMKKNYNLLLLFFTLVLVSSCKKDEVATPAPTLVGKWDATDVVGKATTLDFQTGKPTDQDLSQKLTGFTFDFKEDKTFTASSGVTVDVSKKTTPIAGTYTLTGNDLKINYKKDGKDTVEYYTIGLTSSTMTMSLNKDLYIKGLTESKEPNVALIAILISAIDLKINFKKL